jgi:hypothetical protein
MSLDHRSPFIAKVLTSEDCRQLSNRFAQIAIGSSEPTVAEALMVIAFNYASRACKLSETTDDDQQRNKRCSSVEGFGD